MTLPTASPPEPEPGFSLERCLRATADQPGVAVVGVDALGVIRAASPGVLALFGYAPQELAGRPSSLLVPEGQDMRLANLLRRCMAERRLQHAHLDARGKDGQALFLSLSFVPLQGPDGQAQGVAVAATDIASEREEYQKLTRNTLEVIRLNAEIRKESTARQLALQSLEELSGRLQGVLSAASQVAIVATSPAGVVSVFNTGAQFLLGYAEEDMVGRLTPLAFLDEDELALRGRLLGAEQHTSLSGMAVLAALAEMQERATSEWSFIRKDGSRFAVELALSVIRGPQGVEGYLLVGVDISGRKAAEALVAEREARMRAILDAAPDGIVTVDQSGVIESLNPAALAMFGYAEGELVGRSMTELVPWQARRRHLAALKRYLATGRPTLVGRGVAEIPGQRRDGSQFPMELTVSEVMLPGKRLFTGIIRDITARRQAEEAERLYTRQLAQQQAALQSDLRAAAEIQKSLLPVALKPDGRYEASWLFEPSATIGGDIFNILTLSADHIAAYILDVSGHGVPSALVAAAAAQALLASARLASSGREPTEPAQVLAALDEEFPLERFDRYFSMVYFVLDLSTGELTYCNGGHPPPVLARASGAMELLEEGGSVVGLGGVVPFEQGRVRLEPGDLLVLYTDGLTEFENAQGTPFGATRLRRLVVSGAGQEVCALLANLRHTYEAFGQGVRPQDDLSVLGLKYLGPGLAGGLGGAVRTVSA